MLGDTIAIGAAHENVLGAGPGAGAVYLYENTAGSWGFDQRLVLNTTGAAQDQFGHSVALGVEKLIVGIPGMSAGGVNDSGAALAYRLKDNQWKLETNIDPLIGADAEEDDQVGYSVAISGDLAILGAPQRDGRSLYGGRSYVGSIWVLILGPVLNSFLKTV